MDGKNVETIAIRIAMGADFSARVIEREGSGLPKARALTINLGQLVNTTLRKWSVAIISQFPGSGCPGMFQCMLFPFLKTSYPRISGFSTSEAYSKYGTLMEGPGRPQANPSWLSLQQAGSVLECVSFEP